MITKLTIYYFKKKKKKKAYKRVLFRTSALQNIKYNIKVLMSKFLNFNLLEADQIIERFFRFVLF